MVLVHAKLYIVIVVTFITVCGANFDVFPSECAQDLGRKLRTLYRLTNLVGRGPKQRELNLDAPPTPEELHFLDINNILRQVLFRNDQSLHCCSPWLWLTFVFATEGDISKKTPYPKQLLSLSAMPHRSLLKSNFRHNQPQFKHIHLCLHFLMSPTSKPPAN